MPANVKPVSATSQARQGAIVLGWLLLVLSACLLLSLCLGSLPLDPYHAIHALCQSLGTSSRFDMDSIDPVLSQIILLRWERTVSAALCGAALSLAGCLMQALLRNPLADPYLLGLSSGAGVGALLALIKGAGIAIVGMASGAGAVITGLLLLTLCHRNFARPDASDGRHVLLLTGVMIGAASTALITLLLALAPDQTLRGMVFWMIGDLDGTTLSWSAFGLLVITLGWTAWKARQIDLLALHGAAAATLGVAVGPLRRILFVLAALLTASTVANAGSIGFVGLVIPHICRRAIGPDHRLLIPATVLGGASFLCLADTLARVLILPQQLPTGVVTALAGVPVFLWQLHRQHRS